MAAPRTLNAKVIHRAIKQGLTLDEFAADYDCTVDEMRANIDRTIGRSYQSEVYRSFKSNQKRAQRHGRVHPEVDATIPPAKIVPSVETILSSAEAASAEPFPRRSTTQTYTPPTPREQRIADLSVQEKQQRQDYDWTVRRYNDIVNQLNGKVAELESIFRKLEGIIDALKEHRTRFSDLMSEVDTLNQELFEVSLEVDKAKELHAHTVEELSLLTAVEVYVYQDGNIESSSEDLSFKVDSTEEADMIRFLTSEIDTMIEYLAPTTGLARLSPKQSWTLARVLICLMRNPDINAEVTFEDSDLETTFHEFCLPQNLPAHIHEQFLELSLPD